MRINVTFLDNEEECCCIDISEYAQISKIKPLIAEIKHENVKLYNYYDLIYKNFILNSIKYYFSGEYLINFYKICSDDKISIGKLENYLKNDDVIVEVFVTAWINDAIHLIVDRNISIGQIKSIIETIIPDSANAKIWNKNGEVLEDCVILNDIKKLKGYQILIMNWDDDDDLDRIFNACCDIHDRWLAIKLCWIRLWTKDLVFDGASQDLIDDTKQQIKDQFIAYVGLNNSRLSIGTSTDIPINLIDSHIYFWEKMVSRFDPVLDDFFDHWEDLRTKLVSKLGLPDFMLLCKYINFSFYNSIIDLIDQVKNQDSNIENISVTKIFINAVDKYVVGPGLTSRDAAQIFLDRFLLRSRTDSEIKSWIDNDKYRNFIIQMNGSIIALIRLPIHNIKTIIELKKVISCQVGVPTQEMVLMNTGKLGKLNDEDAYKGLNLNYVIDIVCNMTNIEILHELGSGSFGSVFLCLNKLSNKKFALKKTNKGDDFYREMNVHSKLCRSENYDLYIGKLRDVDHMTKYGGLYRDKDQICLATEYVPGGSFCEYIKFKKYLKEPEIAKICHQLLLQISKMHNLKIIHRDIKSDNIVVDEIGNVKLIDFGISKYDNKKTPEELTEGYKKYLPGTVFYTAPEILNAEVYSEKVDIWSLGAVVIEMLTGNKPYYKLPVIKVLIKISKEKKIVFNPREPISRELEDFISCCLTPDPVERASAVELIQSAFIDKHSHQMN